MARYHAGWLRLALPRLLDEVAAVSRGGGGGGVNAETGSDNNGEQHQQLQVLLCHVLSRSTAKHDDVDVDEPPFTCSHTRANRIWSYAGQPSNGTSRANQIWSYAGQPSNDASRANQIWSYAGQPSNSASSSLLHLTEVQLDSVLGKTDHHSNATVASSMFLVGGAFGKRYLSTDWSYLRERRYWDPTWVRLLDTNLRGLGLTPYGPLSRLVLSMVAFGTMSQSLKEVILGLSWLGENLRVLRDFLVRVLANRPKVWEELYDALGREELEWFKDAVIADAAGWHPLFLDWE